MNDLVRCFWFKIQVSGVYLINQRVYIDIVHLIFNFIYLCEQLQNQVRGYAPIRTKYRNFDTLTIQPIFGNREWDF